MNVTALAADWPFAILLMLYALCDESSQARRGPRIK
jgi:hypothetical protein